MYIHVYMYIYIYIIIYKYRYRYVYIYIYTYVVYNYAMTLSKYLDSPPFLSSRHLHDSAAPFRHRRVALVPAPHAAVAAVAAVARA